MKSVIEGRKHRIDDLPGVFLPCLVGIGLSSLSEAGTAEAAVEPAQLYEIGEAFELGIQLSYLLVLLGLLGAGTFFVIRQALVRRELDLSAKELQVFDESIRSNNVQSNYNQSNSVKTVFETIEFVSGTSAKWRVSGTWIFRARCCYASKKDLPGCNKIFATSN